MNKISPPSLTNPITHANHLTNIWSKWFRDIYARLVSLTNNAKAYPVRSCSIAFTGSTSDGEIQPSSSFNVETLKRVSTGVYEITLKQLTFNGIDITAHLISFTSSDIAAGTFKVEASDVNNGIITVSIYEFIQGVGTDIDLTLVDPVSSGDIVRVISFSEDTTGELPPK